MADIASINQAVASAIGKIPFNPFRGSGQGARGTFSDRFQRVEFPSVDGTTIVGRYASHGSGAPAIVIGHGVWLGKDIDSLVDPAEALFDLGFDVLVPDFQGHGETAKISDAPYTMGWKESENLRGAGRFLKVKGAPRVGLIGFSMAAAAAILASRDEPESIDAMVAISAPAKQEAHFIMSHIDKWLRIQKADPVSYFNQAGEYYGITGAEVRKNDETVVAIRRIRIPALFIHAEDDDFIPPSDADQVSAAAQSNPNALVHTVGRGGHGTEFYLNSRYFFVAAAAAFLKAHLAPGDDAVTVTPKVPVDVQLTIAPGWDGFLLCSVFLRNNQAEPVTNVTVTLPLLENPAPAYLAAPPQFAEGERNGGVLTWNAESLPGNGELVGPFTIAIRIPDIAQGTRLRTRVTVSWSGPSAGEARSNETGYTVR